MTTHRVVIEHDEELGLASISDECGCDVCVLLQEKLKEFLEDENDDARHAAM